MFDLITDIEGIKVGNFTDTKNGTGCTVILFDDGAVAGVDIRGTASGTRQMDALNHLHIVEKIHGILLSGGSAFGLDAGGGVLKYLEERKIGFDTSAGKIPVVPTAVIYDLGFKNAKVRPDARIGYAAAEKASYGRFEEGSVGAGTGASTGKLFGIQQATKGGLGSASVKGEKGLIIGAIAVVNAFGDVIDPAGGKIIAGTRTSSDEKKFADASKLIREGVVRKRFAYENTTLVVVATNARLSKTSASKVAQMAQVGLTKVISPAHSTFDGDMVFVVSAGKIEADTNTIGLLAEEAVVRSIIKGVKKADGLGFLPAYRDLI